MKKFICGFLVGCLLMMATPVLADSIVKSIDVILNSVEVQVNGEKLDANTILYNGSTYLPMRKIAEAVGKDVEWNQETMTANIVNKKIISNELPYIINQGFQNNGTSTMYSVAFSDGFIVGMSVPKQTIAEINPLFEYVRLAINIKNMSSTDTVTTPNVVGFNEYLGYKYYPIGFDDYKNNLPDELKTNFKNLDFYENFKLYKSDDASILGLIYYESFPLLDGITYDDGVHKCNLYLEDTGR